MADWENHLTTIFPEVSTTSFRVPLVHLLVWWLQCLALGRFAAACTMNPLARITGNIDEHDPTRPPPSNS